MSLYDCPNCLAVLAGRGALARGTELWSCATCGQEWRQVLSFEPLEEPWPESSDEGAAS